MTIVTTVEELEAIYGTAGAASLAKVAHHITDEYARIIEASPFCALATVGPEGLDCSPRGDMRGFVHIRDEKNLLLPDRRGNNRIDSLRNIVRDPRVALMFLVPGSGNALRINGRAVISTDQTLCDGFAVNGKAPRSVMVIEVGEVYFQCARAIARSQLWNPDNHVHAEGLPTPGEILSELSKGQVGGKSYDEAWPARAEKTMW
ncbi:pyridoxamine 5'-phosphate oxidase family protein [Hoeflea prorocentri]|uniref:Pyridoxamine 5'-phosphate oxidase family protein n=1 Tax=Hoeflea prorocentri TaxID=1922333 RepID=A0A9X3UGC9_9HYPH|nr:pyridoxamine 5'-phosphate oxidase family protein [Hoeflea prorocentri]MCY6380288.1 pyridoxamine 5'-phosphate oxidase family protein [Hoeflea prorocentri]MDA5398088.1 pyridoxamine 5'-phosphate oxidase family protein [Hoeflea prorocentri]